MWCGYVFFCAQDELCQDHFSFALLMAATASGNHWPPSEPLEGLGSGRAEQRGGNMIFRHDVGKKGKTQTKRQPPPSASSSSSSSSPSSSWSWSSLSSTTTTIMYSDVNWKSNRCGSMFIEHVGIFVHNDVIWMWIIFLYYNFLCLLFVGDGISRVLCQYARIRKCIPKRHPLPPQPTIPHNPKQPTLHQPTNPPTNKPFSRRSVFWISSRATACSWCGGARGVALFSRILAVPSSPSSSPLRTLRAFLDIFSIYFSWFLFSASWGVKGMYMLYRWFLFVFCVLFAGHWVRDFESQNSQRPYVHARTWNYSPLWAILDHSCSFFAGASGGSSVPTGPSQKVPRLRLRPSTSMGTWRRCWELWSAWASMRRRRDGTTWHIKADGGVCVCGGFPLLLKYEMLLAFFVGFLIFMYILGDWTTIRMKEGQMARWRLFIWAGLGVILW